MAKPSGRVLKKNRVKFEGRFLLEAGGSSASGPAKASGAASLPREVRLVQNEPEFAVVEVTCCCGEKTQVRCEYKDVPSAEQ